VREQDVAFGRSPCSIMTSTTSPRFTVIAPERCLKLFERNDALGLVSEVDDDVFRSNAEDRALQNFIGGRWGKVAVIFEESLVVSLPAHCFGPGLRLRNLNPPNALPEFEVLRKPGAGLLQSPGLHRTEHRRHQQPLRDQYVSKYTPSDYRLSTGVRARSMLKTEVSNIRGCVVGHFTLGRNRHSGIQSP
jgi:hypothetical protein